MTHRPWSMVACAVLVVAACGLTGCPIVIRRPAAAPVVKPPGEPASSPSGRTPIAVTGPWTHEGLEVTFPTSSAGWRRVTVDRYDAEMNDVGVGYRRTFAGRRTEVTIYLFPRYFNPAAEPIGLDDEFEGESAEVRRAFSVLREIPPVSGTGRFRDRDIPGRARSWPAKDPTPFASGTVHTRLTTYAADPWRIKYRVTTQLGEGVDETAVHAAIDELLASLGLPALEPIAGEASEAGSGTSDVK